jgi:hypothetical protein
MEGIVMQLLGNNVSTMRKLQPDEELPLVAALSIGLQVWCNSLTSHVCCAVFV